MNEKNVRSIPELFGSMVFSQAQSRQRQMCIRDSRCDSVCRNGSMTHGSSA